MEVAKLGFDIHGILKIEVVGKNKRFLNYIQDEFSFFSSSSNNFLKPIT